MNYKEAIPMKRNGIVIPGIMVVTMTLSVLCLFSCQGPAAKAPFVPAALRLVPARAAGSRTVTGVEKEPEQEPRRSITLERTPSAGPSLPARISFSVGSRQVDVDGVWHTMDIAPAYAGGRLYLPVVDSAYAIGAVDGDILWNPATRSVVLNFDTRAVVFTLGSPLYTVDGSVQDMDAVPLVVSGRMEVPPACFAAAFGYKVVENRQTRPEARLALPPGSYPDCGDVFVVVNTQIPERLYVCRGGSVVLTTYCNTGIPAAPTPEGVFRVYLKMPSDTMSGKNPNGSSYYDPGVPWVMYFYGGCAIHGFVRAAYGFPQSLGCVELPVATARKVYGLVPVGTKVFIK